MIRNQEIERLQTEYGFDYLTAWRHLRDRAILQRRLAYQNERKRIFAKW